MTDAYRTSGLPCPTCTGASLREFARRYICDECRGMLIDFDDFDQALGELAGEHPNPRVDYGERSNKACPRCERALVECKLVLELERKKVSLEHTFLRCERDGLWCPGGALEAALETASKINPRAGARSLFGDSSDAAIGPDGLPERRFGLGGGRGAGSARAERPPVIDPYVGQVLRCPSCADESLVFQADRWTCPACTGTFVQSAALVAMVMDVSARYWELPPIGSAVGARSCPVCRNSLITEELERVNVDRCAEHGIWFDAGELAQTLQHSGQDTRGWLARLFRPR